MANVSLRSVPANAYSGNAESHYSIPKIPWFMSFGHSGTYLPSFTPDLGSTAQYYTNDEAGSSGYSYVFDKKDPFWSDDNGHDGGFSLQKPSTTEPIEFNYKIAGGYGIWMPCPIFRSISFWWKNDTAVNSNFITRRIGLVLKNWRTDEEKTWGYDSTTSSYATDTGKVCFFSSSAKAQSVRDLGPDWFVYGVIFNFYSRGTGSNQSPRGLLSDLRLGYYMHMGAGIYRMFLTQNQSWSSLKLMMSGGVVRYPKET